MWRTVSKCCSWTSSLDGGRSSKHQYFSLKQGDDLWLWALLHSWLPDPNVMQRCVITSTEGGAYVTASIRLSGCDQKNLKCYDWILIKCCMSRDRLVTFWWRSGFWRDFDLCLLLLPVGHLLPPTWTHTRLFSLWGAWQTTSGFLVLQISKKDVYGFGILILKKCRLCH